MLPATRHLAYVAWTVFATESVHTDGTRVLHIVDFEVVHGNGHFDDGTVRTRQHIRQKSEFYTKKTAVGNYYGRKLDIGFFERTY